MTTSYDYCGSSLGTLIELPELASTATDSVDFVVTTGAHAAPLADSLPWIHQWQAGSRPELSVGRVRDDYLLRFNDGNDFVFSPSNRTIQIVGDPTAAKRTQLLNHVLPRVFDHDGRFIMHGSAVATYLGVIAFIGKSGWGKSTLAACFHAMGHELLSDDCMEFSVVDGQAWCRPTYQSLRLWPDSVEAVMRGQRFEQISEDKLKERFQPASPKPSEPKRLAMLCILGDPHTAPATVEFGDCSPARTVAALLAHSFRLDPTDHAAAERGFNSAAEIVEAVPVFTLDHPRSYEQLPEVCAAVLAHAAATHAS